SDLTEIEDEDDEYGKSEKGKSDGWRLRHVLPIARATTYSTQALYDQISQSFINLEPDYQRDVVWPESKQINLIDSLFRNYFIPPVIFVVKAEEDGTESRVCIDGKQRLTSIHRFMAGLIPCSVSDQKFWYKIVGSSKTPKRELPERYRRQFDTKQVVCVEYHDITDRDEREIFQRVQLGMALTPAEKLAVLSTRRSSFVRQLLQEFLTEGSHLAGKSLDWERSRGGDYRCLAQALYYIMLIMEEKPIKIVSSIDVLTKWLAADDQVSKEFAERCRDTLKTFQELVSSSKYNTVFRKFAKVAPVEFIMITTLISARMDSMKKSELSQAIGKMRQDVRKHHDDIRNNTKCQTTLLDFICNTGGDRLPSLIRTATRNGTAKKRAKRSDSSDDDSDDDYGPKKRKVPAKSTQKAKSTSSPAKRKVIKSSKSPSVKSPSVKSSSVKTPSSNNTPVVPPAVPSYVPPPSPVPVDPMAVLRAS
ncbi:hypothetical protein FISHEDRAFT_10842, partial [Fistulina hepatica ATCC 64428]